MLALEGRECRELLEDALGQVAERAGVAGGEPEHMVAEPVGAVQLELEWAGVREELPSRVSTDVLIICGGMNGASTVMWAGMPSRALASRRSR